MLGMLIATHPVPGGAPFFAASAAPASPRRRRGQGIERERHEAIPRGVGAHFILIEADLVLTRFEALCNGPAPAGNLDERPQRDAPRREDDRVRAIPRGQMLAHEQGVMSLGADARERHQGPVVGAGAFAARPRTPPCPRGRGQGVRHGADFYLPWRPVPSHQQQLVRTDGQEKGLLLALEP